MPPLMTVVTADLFDRYEAKVASCQTQFRQFGARRAFHGQIVTVRCFEDNVLLKQALSTPGQGRVLVVDGGGSLGAALLGDVIGGIAVTHGWGGVLIHGAVRDTVALSRLELGVKALGTNPKKSLKKGTGEANVPVTFGGVTFVPGHFLYSDDDGVLVSPDALGV